MFLKNFEDELLTVPGFKEFWIKDKNPLGGTVKLRLIKAPNESMRILHGKLKLWLRSLEIKLPFAAGARRGDSPVKNVKRHRYNRYFYLTDLKRAYQYVDGKKLALILCRLEPKLAGQEKDVFEFLEKYCLSPEGGLIIGAPASPDFFNIYAGILIDGPLAPLCEKSGITFSRYLDDLSFSSGKLPIGKRKRKTIRMVVEAAGSKINHRESRVLDLKRGPVEINGVGLEFGGRIFLPRHFAKKILGMLHSAMQENNINPEKIHGMMGVFFDLTDRKNPNQTERKIMRKYQAYRRLIKWGTKT